MTPQQNHKPDHLSVDEKERRRQQRMASHQQRISRFVDRYLGTADAAAFMGCSEVQWRKLVKAGKVPQPVRVGGRKLLWRQSLLSEFAAALEVEQGVSAPRAA